MIEPSENLSLVAEPFDGRLALGDRRDHLDCHTLLVRVIVAHGEVDGAHTASTYFPFDAIWPDPAVDRIGGYNAEDQRSGLLEERRLGVMPTEQRIDTG